MNTEVSLWRSELERLRADGALVSIWTNHVFSGPFEAGVVRGVTRMAYILERVSPDGLPDGLLAGRIEDIVRLETQSTHLKCLERLRSHHERVTLYSPTADGVDVKVSADDESLFARLLAWASEARLVCTLFGEVTDSGITALVDSVIEEHIARIRPLNEFGHAEGQSQISIRDLTRLLIDGITERRVQFLNTTLKLD